MPEREDVLTPAYPAINSEPSGVSWWWGGLFFFLFGLFLIGEKVKASAPAAPRADDTRWVQMTGAIGDIVGSYDGEVGLYIKDLKTGRTFERNADQTFVSASLIKVPIMAAAFEAIQEGRIALNTRLRLKRHYRRDGSGRLKWARTGSRFPISYLVHAMITQSDNTATAMMIDLLGYDALNRSFHNFGLEQTRISPRGMSLSNRLDPSLENYTTPREMGAFLERMYKHELVNDGLSDLMLEIMKGATARSRLAEYLPDQFRLARKTGLLRGNCHDMGIIFTPSGDYVICVLTRRNHNYREAKSMISSVGQTAYLYMQHS